MSPGQCLRSCPGSGLHRTALEILVHDIRPVCSTRCQTVLTERNARRYLHDSDFCGGCQGPSRQDATAHDGMQAGLAGGRAATKRRPFDCCANGAERRWPSGPTAPRTPDGSRSTPSIDDGVGAMVELQCESAPVASHEEFRQLADDLARQLATGPGAGQRRPSGVNPRQATAA